MSWYLNELEELRIACKVLARYHCDNNNQALTYMGKAFSFFVSVSTCAPGSIRDKEYRQRFGVAYTNKGLGEAVFEFCLWNSRGSRALWKETFLASHLKPMPEKIRSTLVNAMDDYFHGTLKCSDCRAAIVTSAIAGNYFAGSYCSPCWLGEAGEHKGRGGWKAVEARETYE